MATKQVEGISVMDHLAVPLLSVERLCVSFTRHGKTFNAVNDVSFDVSQGESIGIVGESGSGKSVTALSLMRLLNPVATKVTGRIDFGGVDLASLSAREMCKVRGSQMAMVFQEPMTALDPTFTIGSQIAETVLAHYDIGRKAAKERAIEMLDRVGIPAARERYSNYPNQLSGGMRQRVMIGIALACEPRLLIADEPTTALDTTVQAQIMDLMVNLTTQSNTALMLITHDLAVVSRSCGRTMTMYGGTLVESGSTAAVLRQPLHPYTSGLLSAIPGRGAAKARLASVPGRLGAVHHLEGCRFMERCSYRQQRCADRQTMSEGSHIARCCRVAELELPGAQS